MINENELISNVEERIAYDNSMRDYSKRRSIKRKVVATLCSLMLVCALTFVADAATDGAISSKFRSYFYNPDGTREEMPVDVTVNEDGTSVYKFKKEFNQDGKELTVEGEYYDNNGDLSFGEVNVLNEDGTISEDCVVLNFFADSDEEADEFQKLIQDLNNNPVEE